MEALRFAVAFVCTVGFAVLTLAAEPPVFKSASDALRAVEQEISGAAEAIGKELTAADKRKKKRTGAEKQKTPAKPATVDEAAKAHKSESAGTVELPVRKGEPPAETAGEAKTGEPAKPAEPAPGKDQAKDAPKDGKDAAAAKAPPPEPTEWPAIDIELAKARCTHILKGLDVVTLPEPPFRKGDCGAPAPVRLVSIGKNPEVAISPPALMTCDLAAGLHKWVTQDLQPLAKKHLDSQVIKIEAMSDYSCRRAYGRIGNRLSEHAHANALDIRGFVTAAGKTAHVLEEWGRTQRDVEAAARAAAELAAAEQAAKEKAEREKAEKDKSEKTDKKAGAPAEAGKDGKTEKSGSEAGGKAAAGSEKPVKVTVRGPDGAPLTVTARVRTTLKDGTAKRTAALDPKDKGKPQTLTRLGGPAEPEPAAKTAGPPLPIVLRPDKSNTKLGRFLREAHGAACRIFGTTLGPEANEAHRNHFHVDMAERKHRKICD